MGIWVPIDDAIVMLNRSRRTIDRAIQKKEMQARLEYEGKKPRRMVLVEDKHLPANTEEQTSPTSESDYYIEGWTKAAAGGLIIDGMPYAPETIRCYKVRIKLFFKHYQTINLYNVRKALLSLCETPASRDKFIKAITSYTRYLVVFEGLSEEVLMQIKTLKSGYQLMKPRRVISRANYVKLYLAIKRNPTYSDDYRLFLTTVVSFLWYTGARCEGVCRIKVTDLNWDNPKRIPTATLIEKGKGGVKKEREVPINRKLHIILKYWLEHREQTDKEVIFYNPWAEVPLITNSLSKLMTRLSRKYKIPFHTHSFRYGGASDLDAKGASLPAISDWLGHSRRDTTEKIYIHRSKNASLREVHAVMNR